MKHDDRLAQPFTDPAAVARYAEGPPRKVPGFADLQRMAMLLLSEAAPGAADILVLGAGGGLELTVFAQGRPDWRLLGVDPSAAMLDLARVALGPLASRVALLQGYIDDAPAGPFDGAACLLTLHFLAADERSRTLRAVRQRLKPDARFVMAHYSFPQDEGMRWLARSAAFAASSGLDPTQASASAAAIMERLPVLSPEQDEALLREAGFSDVELFYAGLAFRGWVGTAS
ncbi:MAG: class I SAM-dependent methyltransferase [Sphingomonas sp.]|jgi:tRNA (cmo5U34)-methyltransferase|uniref:class I SAM-dependent methyltransferase n=1 Tax=Sphingomonas sp. TaxID=28214 RepID=UPI0035637AF2